MINNANMSAEHFRRPARRSIILVPITILSLAVTPMATADSGANATFTGNEWETGRLEVSFERDFSIDSFRPEMTVSFGRDVTERLAFETEITLWDSSLSYVPPHESIDTHLSKVEDEDFGEVSAKLEWRWSEEVQLQPENLQFFRSEHSILSRRSCLTTGPRNSLGLRLREELSVGPNRC